MSSHTEVEVKVPQASKAPCPMCDWIKVAQLHPRYAHDCMTGPGHTCRENTAKESQ